MRVYTSQLINKPPFMSRGKEAPPKPFPGKAPTRLFILGTNGNKEFFYRGKPFSALYQQFQDFSANPECMQLKCIVIEYDRAGIILSGRVNQITGECHMNLVESLWSYYHPEIAHQPLLHWLHWPFVVNGHHQYLIA